MLLVLMLLGSVLPFRAGAIDLIDLNAKGSLTIVSKFDEKTPLAGAQFTIYKIATPDVNCNLTAEAAFTAYLAGTDLNKMSKESWEALASKLGADIGSIPGAVGTTLATDKNGSVTFSELTLGLYLVVSAPHKQDKITYQQAPALVMVPDRNQDPTKPEEGSIDVWKYNVTLKTKPISAKDALKVIKVWEDKNDADGKRPESITVYLLKDGVRVKGQEVVLSQENNWQHIWEPLEYGPVWSVEEETAGLSDRRYKLVSTERDDKGTEYIVYTITNKYTPKPPKLPQTGQLWWPVPVLVSLGMLCMLFGLIRRRGEKHEA